MSTYRVADPANPHVAGCLCRMWYRGLLFPVGRGPSLTDGEAGGSCPGETVAGEVHREKAGCAASVNETVIQSELHGGDWRRPRESSLSLTRHVNREAGGIPIQHFDLASLQELAGTAVK